MWSYEIDQYFHEPTVSVTFLSFTEKKIILYKMKLILNNSTEVWIKKTEVLMNSLATKFKTLVLLALIGGLTFQCEKKEDDTDLQSLLAISLVASSQGDCTVNAPPRASINTFQNAVTANGSSSITKTGTVAVVGHQTAALKLTAKNGTRVAMTGNSFVIVYQSSSCPLTTSTRTGFTVTSLSDSNSEFTNSYTLASTGNIDFTTAGDYYIFFYAIPSRGQSASISYTVTGL
ncbi:LIC20153 family lipoprotein [Leptospira bouyouniensis]|uniref:Lipoprotein n=2 Tax=Leptospira bouyouniensis TaxID=2484911 RepID=A0ABY2L7Q1_9LEPT|nr:hypothetical protein [Leptospira bouyouniensis]TGK49119.1 hypothetical protein EHQ10_09465 [Leptospira bouyouniensis]